MEKDVLVFLVDDDTDDQGLFMDALTEINKSIRLITASNGAEALRKLSAELLLVPDFIFMDLNMPLMNGIQCLKELKKNPAVAGIPVIIYSTSSYEKDIHDAMQAGAANYLIKPFSFPELCDRLKELMQ